MADRYDALGEAELIPDLTPAAAAVRHLMHASRELTNRVARSEGRSTTDLTALGLLDMLGPLSPTELAEHLGMRTASATVLVDRLERAGEAHRTAHPSDRRRVVVQLDDAHRDRARTTWFPIISELDAAVRELPEQEQAVVTAFLQRAAQVLDAHPRAGGTLPG